MCVGCSVGGLADSGTGSSGEEAEGEEGEEGILLNGVAEGVKEEPEG